MKVLVVGGGGREHALAWACARSPRVERVLVAPGNAGTAAEGGIENVACAADDVEGLVQLARERGCALTIVGPEAPLVAGVADAFEAAGLRLFGPQREAAALEGSKTFAKAFLERHGVPTAAYRSFAFAEREAAIAYVRGRGAPIVVKADGLAAGKGVTVARSVQDAVAALESMLSGRAFGEAGRRVVVEDFLEGEEASFTAIVDGEQVLALASSQDHKARDDGDRGPNTGGMGAYSPAPVVSEAVHARVMREVVEPAVRGLASEGRRYRGFLYAGLMIGVDGTPRVLEFNCRLGDPEAEPLLMRLRSDLVELCEAAVEGRLDRARAEWDPQAALGVVMAADGYPGACRKGDVIEGLDREIAGTKVFHAGTRLDDGRVVTAGGRVLCVCALGPRIADAKTRAYERVRQIRWEGAFYRGDIGDKALSRDSSLVTRHS